MSTYVESKDSELLIELSEQQQETIAGGSTLAELDFDYFFFQQTDIRSKADTSTKFDVASGSGASSGETEYSLSQTTLAFGSFPESRSQPKRIFGGIIGGVLDLLFGFF